MLAVEAVIVKKLTANQMAPSQVIQTYGIKMFSTSLRAVEEAVLYKQWDLLASGQLHIYFGGSCFLLSL